MNAPASHRAQSAPAAAAAATTLRTGLVFGPAPDGKLGSRLIAGTGAFLANTLPAVVQLTSGEPAAAAAAVARERLQVIVFDRTLPTATAARLRQAGVVLIHIGADATLTSIADLCLDPSRPARATPCSGPRYVLRSLIRGASDQELADQFGSDGRDVRAQIDANSAERELIDVVSLCKLLSWDTAFFGFPILHVSCRRLTPAIDACMREVAAANRIALVELLCACEDHTTVANAERAGYALADIRVTLERSPRDFTPRELPAGLSLVRAAEAHIAALRALAGRRYEDSRFFCDRHFEPAKARELFAVWIEKAVRGTFDDECLILTRDGQTPLAWCTLRHRPRESAIGLFGMAPEAEGRQWAGPFLDQVVAQVAKTGAEHLQVVTQARNVRAQRVYQRAGFVTKAMELWYHRWYEKAG